MKKTKKKKVKTILKRKDGKPDGRSRPKTSKHLSVHSSPRAKRKGQGGQIGNKNSEKWTEESALNLGHELIKWLTKKREAIGKDGKLNGSAEGVYLNEFLLMEKKLHIDTIGDLSQRFESFADLLRTAKAIKEVKLWKKGASGELAPAIVIFDLKNNHGAKDRLEHEVKQTKTLVFDNKLEKALTGCQDGDLRKMLVAERPDEEEVIGD